MATESERAMLAEMVETCMHVLRKMTDRLDQIVDRRVLDHSELHLVQAAWRDIEPRAIRLKQSLLEPRSDEIEAQDVALEQAALTGPNLVMKHKVLVALARKVMAKGFRRSRGFLRALIPRGLGPLMARDLLGRFLKAANSFLSSVPGGDAIKEYKDVLEVLLDPSVVEK